MKHIARKITILFLSVIVTVTLLPSHAQAADWYDVPTRVLYAISYNGYLGVVLAISCPTASPSDEYYLKLTCIEDSTTAYYGTDILIGIESGNDIPYATLGRPMVIPHVEDINAETPPPGGSTVVTFYDDIVDLGKHYTVQLVTTSNGGLSYTELGDPSEAIEIINPTAPIAETPKYPYWWPCYKEIKKLGESTDPQTLVFEEGTALPIEIMQALQECPNVTLIFKCCYQETDYEFTIPGDKAIVIDDVPWYGPLWLNQYYSKESLSTGRKHLVVAGNTLNQIAATYHTTVEALLAKNEFIKDKDKIYVGQLISY